VLQAKNPAEDQDKLRDSAEAIMAERHNWEPALQVDMATVQEQILSCVAGMDPTSAPGPDGFQGGYMRTMLRGAGGQVVLLPVLAELIFTNFNNPVRLPAVWFAAQGTANLSAVGVEKLRPIACASWFRRLAGRLWCGLNLSRVSLPLFEAGQLGVGISQGVERAASEAHLAHAAGLWIVALDLRNAFNSVLRNAIICGLHKICPELVPYFVAMYCTRPPNLLFRKDDGSVDIISSQSGAQQGDPLGPFFFCVGIYQVMNDYRATHGTAGSGRDLSSFIDDMRLFFWKMDASALEAVAELLAALKVLGLVANDTKTEVLAPEGHVPTEEEHQLLAARGLVAKDCIVVVGVPVGSAEGQKAFLLKSLDRLNFDRLARDLALLPNKQVAYQLLLSCLAAKPSFLARNVAPSMAKDFFICTDSTLLWVLEHILEMPQRASAETFFSSNDRQSLLTLTQMQRLQLPLRMGDGGLQLRSMMLECGSAFVGAQVDTMGPLLTKLVRLVPAAHLPAAQERLVRCARLEGLFQAISQLKVPLERLSPTIPAELVAAAAGGGGGGAEWARRVALIFSPDLLEGEHRQTQRRLYAHVKKKLCEELVQVILSVPETIPLGELDGQRVGSVVRESRMEVKTRIFSCSGAVAGAWSRAPPGGDTAMQNRQFMNALRLRLGIFFVVAEGAVVCRGANCRFGHAANTKHALTCRNGQHAVAHTKVVRGVQAELRKLHINYEYESGVPFAHNVAEEDRRLRLEIVIPAGAFRNVKEPEGVIPSDKELHELLPNSRVKVATRVRNHRVSLDVTVACPFTLACQRFTRGVPPSHIMPGVALGHAEASKMLSYHGKYRVDVDCLRTFAFESFGRPGRQALHIMELFAEQAGGARGTDRTRKLYLRGVHQRMSVALQRAVGDGISRYEDMYGGGFEVV
jgi:hypothetical protein